MEQADLQAQAPKFSAVPPGGARPPSAVSGAELKNLIAGNSPQLPFEQLLIVDKSANSLEDYFTWAQNLTIKRKTQTNQQWIASFGRVIDSLKEILKKAASVLSDEFYERYDNIIQAMEKADLQAIAQMGL